jgi:hypothetical protein
MLPVALKGDTGVGVAAGVDVGAGVGVGVATTKTVWFPLPPHPGSARRNNSSVAHTAIEGQKNNSFPRKPHLDIEDSPHPKFRAVLLITLVRFV